MRFVAKNTAWLFAASALLSHPSIAGINQGLAAYKSGDYRTAYVELRPLADQGDDDAQVMMGLMYEQGHGVQRSYSMARSWYEKAAAKGNAAAEYEVSLIYSVGLWPGIHKDLKKAAGWTKRAAEHGHPRAEYELGQIYEEGKLMPKDDVTALSWTRKSAQQGDEFALVSLGQRYELGKGVQKDAVTACAYYYIALRRGSSVSDLFLDGLTRKMTTEQMKEAQSTASNWSPGKPLPVGATASHP